MLSQEHHIQPLVQREATQLRERFPAHAQTIERLTSEYAARFRDELRTFDDAFELCRRVQGMLDEHEVPDDLLSEINSSRRRILFELLQHGLTHRTLEGSAPLRWEMQFTPPPPTNGNGRGRRSQSREHTEEEVREIIRSQNFDLLRLAAGLGVDAAADVLCAMGQVGEEERSRVISFISAYLGQSARPEPLGGPEILRYPRAVLDVPAVHTVARRILLQDLFIHLQALGVDDPDQHTHVRRHVGRIALQRMTDLARQVGVTDPTVHASLFMELSNSLQQACSQPHPNTLVQSLEERGQSCPFPSLRQLIAVQQLKDRRHLYVGFEPGLGKTPIPFHLFEQMRAEGKHPRMLYLAPPPVIQEIPNRIQPGSSPQPTRDCYYVDPAMAPSVGVVQSGMKNHILEEIAGERDVTFCSYTMLHSPRDLNRRRGEEAELEREERRLIDLLSSQDWDILVLDEAHSIDGNKAWTRLVDRLIHGQTGRGTHLSREGYVVALSGSPVMNTIADPVVIHDLFQSPRERRQRYENDLRDTEGRDTATERGLDPRRVRAALNDTLLILDHPEPWLEHVEMLDYPISDREMAFIRAICSNPTLTAKHKIDATTQFLLCPQLVSGDETMPESLLEWMTMQLEHDLGERNSILIAENMRAQGVLRASDGEDPGPDEVELHLFRKIEQFCQDWAQRNGIPVNFFTVHRDVAQADRQRAYADAAQAQSSGEHKTVIFAMSQCLNVGIRLHIDRIIDLEWPYNSPEIQQLLKRALREGQDDVHLTACYSRGTVQEGIYHQAMDKYEDALQCLYGTGVSDSILRAHVRERQRVDAPESESELFRILDRSAPGQRRSIIEQWLHGRGMNGVTQFWDRHRDLFTMLYDEADDMGTGDMQRFLAGLVTGMVDRTSEQNMSILDVNSGGLTLERELRRLGRGGQTQVMSVDPLPLMLERGRTAIHRDDQSRHDIPSAIQASPVEVHRHFQSGRMGAAPYDIGILRNLEQCNYTASDRTVHERARALLNLVKTVRIGGRIVIPLTRTACTNEEFEHFVQETLPLFNCLPVEGWVGPVRSQDNEGDEPFRGFCVVAEKYDDVDEQTLRENIREAHFHFSHHSSWATTTEGVRVTNATRRPRLPFPLRHEEFRLGNRTFTAANARPEVRHDQIEHLRALEQAVQAVRELAPTAREWNALSASERSPLRRRGILYSQELSHTVSRPVFTLRRYPNHLFFPFDPQWRTE